MTIRLGPKHDFFFSSQVCHISRKREAGIEVGIRLVRLQWCCPSLFLTHRT